MIEKKQTGDWRWFPEPLDTEAPEVWDVMTMWWQSRVPSDLEWDSGWDNRCGLLGDDAIAR